MYIEETKQSDCYKYKIYLQEGTLEYYCDKKLRNKDTRRLHDEIFLSLQRKPNGKGKFEHRGFVISYLKNIPVWLED